MSSCVNPRAALWQLVKSGFGARNLFLHLDIDLRLLIKHGYVVSCDHNICPRNKGLCPTSQLRSVGIDAVIQGRENRRISPYHTDSLCLFFKLEKEHKTHRCVEQAGRESPVWYLMEKLCLGVLLWLLRDFTFDIYWIRKDIGWSWLSLVL